MEKTINGVITAGEVSIARFVVNTLRENTYIYYNNNVREGILVDCGVRRAEEQAQVADFIHTQGITIKHHLLTHAHFDHLWGAQWAFDTYGVAPTLPRLELNNYLHAECMMQQVLHKPLALPLPPDPILTDEGQTFGINSLSLTFIHTPGHTRGSFCLYDATHGILFAGDTIFRDHTSLPKEEGMTPEIIQETVRTKIHTLPQNTLILPGHGPEFTL